MLKFLKKDFLTYLKNLHCTPTIKVPGIFLMRLALTSCTGETCVTFPLYQL